MRRFRVDRDVTAEAEMMRYVREHRFPVPTVYRAAGRELEMERLDGPTMMKAMRSGDLGVPAGVKVLADLHTMLHAVPPPRGTPPSHRIIHLDLHPENVLLTRRGPMVIDWTNAAYGSPNLDLAATAVIMAEVAVLPGHPLADLARTALAHFLELTNGLPVRELDAAIARRQVDRSLSDTEKARLPEVAALVRALVP